MPPTAAHRRAVRWRRRGHRKRHHAGRRHCRGDGMRGFSVSWPSPSMIPLPRGLTPDRHGPDTRPAPASPPDSGRSATDKSSLGRPPTRQKGPSHQGLSTEPNDTKALDTQPWPGVLMDSGPWLWISRGTAPDPQRVECGSAANQALNRGKAEAPANTASSSSSSSMRSSWLYLAIRSPRAGAPDLI